MAEYGVTDIGFVRPRLPELRRDIISDLKDRLAANNFPTGIETRPDSLYGLFIDTFGEREAALWETMEQVYYAMYPGSARGAALDRAVSFAGVERTQAEPSRANVVLYGDASTTVPAGSQIRNRSTNTLWQTTEDQTIGAGEAIDLEIAVDTVADSTLYKVTLDATDYTYTSTASATRQGILDGLTSALASASQDTRNNGAVLKITGRVDNFSVSLSGNLVFNLIGSQVVAETIESIPEETLPGYLSAIVTLVTGWDTVNNLTPGTVGRRTETDSQLRQRYKLGVFRLGRSTQAAMEANIFENVLGVEAVRVFQNATDNAVDGLVPHSVQVVAQGGLDKALAEEIYANKAAGIDTNGAVVVNLTTGQGPQKIKFDRPESVYIWVKVVITLLDAEEGEQPFPSNGFDQIRQQIADYGNSLTIGFDVLPERFYRHIFEVPGIETATITTDSSTNASHTPSYSSGIISIDRDQLSQFDTTQIVVQ